MRCCPHCFKDKKAREMVASLASDEAGVCDLCGCACGSLLLVSPESELSEQFFDLLSVFSPAGDAGNAHETIFDAFCATWDLLQNVSADGFSKLIEAMFPGSERVRGLLEGPVYLDPSPSLDDPFALCFFGNRSWIEFSEDIKHVNRYLTRISNEEVMRSLFNALAIDVDPGEKSWYRARLWNGKARGDIKEAELKEAPKEKAEEGRMSPRGVSCLYIADNIEGAMAEIRASRHDEVAIMEMRPKRSLRILDLSKIDEISPFEETVSCGDLASNLVNLRQMKEALTKPMRSTDDAIEYVPTQFIAEFARNIGFDGIGYDSVLYESCGKPSYNIASFALFDEAFECRKLELYCVEKNELVSGIVPDGA